ncbi:asparagine synthase-related protein [Chryseobacterium sp. SIMBA_038]|uniref:asparagine synthase-related protein n=2 Tax=Pseudomonadati TaxID=3379134 RepID=UPI00397A1A5E
MTKGFSVIIKKNQVDTKSFFNENSFNSVLIESSEFDILLEGIILNKKQLLKEDSVSDFNDCIKKKYNKFGWKIIQQFEGEFRGCIWDKKQNKLYVFTNPTATQRVFYSKIKDTFFIDSDLVRLSQTIKNHGYTLKPDMTSIYQILAIGNLLEDRTPIENAYKMLDSQILEIDCESLNFKKIEYFDVNNIPYYNKSQDSALDQIHEIFTEGVKMEYEKDIELGGSHLALLSGGLDSRMAMMYAIKNNFDIDCALCFSQKDYFDEKISRKIASNYNINYEFVPLDKGSFLNKIDELTRISEGTSLYTGGVHVSYALDQLKFDGFSIFHGGQIGDGILGGFNSEPKSKAPSQYKIIVNKSFLPKIQENLDQVFKNYEREEIFLLKNLAYNRTVLGVQVMQDKAYLLSPFMTKEFIKFSISLPEQWKYKHKFYLQWLLKHCNEASKYTWERTLMKPDAQWKIPFGEKYLKGAYNAFYDKILKKPEKTSMYPYQYYYDSDISIQKNYNDYFEENLDRLQEYPELRDDVINLFSSKLFYHKCQAINILSIFKLYF